MYNYFIENPLVAILFLVVVIAVALFLFVKAMKNIGLEKIRSTVYSAFVYAEHEFQYGENTKKFEYVVQLARSSLPKPFNLFITEKSLKRIIQMWFNLCKDLLDDGKVNGTGNTSSD